MAAFQLSKLRQVHRDLGDILETYDALKAAEQGAASDNEQPTGGTRARAAATNSGTAQDSAPSLDTRNRGLKHIPHTRAVASLEAAIPALTRLRGKF